VVVQYLATGGAIISSRVSGQMGIADFDPVGLDAVPRSFCMQRSLGDPFHNRLERRVWSSSI
jgi:hypothetical protein